MLQEVAKTETQAEAPVPTKLPILMVFHQQLMSLKQQRDQIKASFDQLSGAVGICEHMIKQYEDSVKETKEEHPLMPKENLGAINNGKVNDKAKKQVAQK
jgi:GTP1/Obg family GTP-binding protein